MNPMNRKVVSELFFLEVHEILATWNDIATGGGGGGYPSSFNGYNKPLLGYIGDEKLPGYIGITINHD